MTNKRVIATALGFHGGELRYQGDVFDVPENLTGKWFKPFQPQPDVKLKSRQDSTAKSEGRASDQNLI